MGNKDNYHQTNPLLDLEDKSRDLKRKYNTGFLTFIGFLITTIGVIISVERIPICVKYFLCVSIILLVIGLAIFFYISSLETKRVDKSMKYMRQWNMSDKLGNMNDEIEILNKIRKKTWHENILTRLSKICLHCGICSFLVGIIVFLYCL